MSLPHAEEEKVTVEAELAQLFLTTVASSPLSLAVPCSVSRCCLRCTKIWIHWEMASGTFPFSAAWFDSGYSSCVRHGGLNFAQFPA